jgi:hypothetical protein
MKTQRFDTDTEYATLDDSKHKRQARQQRKRVEREQREARYDEDERTNRRKFKH